MVHCRYGMMSYGLVMLTHMGAGPAAIMKYCAHWLMILFDPLHAESLSFLI